MDDDIYKLLEIIDRPVTRRLQAKEFNFGHPKEREEVNLPSRDPEEKDHVTKVEDLDLGHDRSSSQGISSSTSVMIPSPATEKAGSIRMAQYPPDDPENPYNWSKVRLLTHRAF
jgi:hypothetical protein